MPKKMTRDEAVAAFWAKTEKDEATGCVEWTGTKTVDGYGHFSLEGKVVIAHRLAFEWSNGPIPPGLVVRHRCDNPRCVNTDHLQTGTHADNGHDRHERGRAPKPYYRTTEKERADIISLTEARRSGALPGATRDYLADLYEVSPVTIGYVLRKHRKSLSD
jgi:hypothetical protein